MKPCLEMQHDDAAITMLLLMLLKKMLVNVNEPAAAIAEHAANRVLTKYCHLVQLPTLGEVINVAA